MNRETTRQVVHIGCAGFAFALKFLTAPWAFLLAIMAFVHNIFFLPKYAPDLFRGKESVSQGIALYPLMVALLIMLFPHRLNFACAAWGILAFGDGFATLIGKRYPICKIPWNPNKSLGGLFGFIGFGGFGAFLLLAWMGPIPSLQHLLFVAFGAATIAGIFESMPLPWDDNLVVTLVAAVFVPICWSIDWTAQTETIPGAWWGIALLVNFIAAGLAWILGHVSSSGATASMLIGTIILSMGGISLFLLLLLFFILASAATRMGINEKALFGLAQEDAGQRGAKHAVANSSLALLAVILIGSTRGADIYLVVFYCGAVATALADTVSSELGQLFGRNPFMPTTFRIVPPGTVGAISIEGTVWGMLSGMLLALVAFIVQAIPLDLVPAVTVGCWIGFYTESYIGSVWNENGIEVNNEWMNILNTFVGGTVAIAIGMVTMGF